MEIENWKEMKLGDFITLQRGFDLPQRERKPGTIPVISSSGINGVHSEAKVLGPGVVTGRYGTIGQVFYIKGDFWPLNTTLFVKDFKANDPLFTSFLLRTINFHSCSDKSSVPGVNRNDLHNIEVKVPPLSEQKAIADILGTLDEKIELNQQMNETLEAMARAIFKSWFVDFDPVRAKMEGRQPAGMDAATANLFPDEFEESSLGLIPKGWRVVNLGDVISIYDSKRIPLSARERSTRQGKYPYYGAASVMDFIDDYLFDGIYILVGEDGSVIDNNDHPIIQYVWGKFWVNNHAHVLQGSNGISNEHLMLFLKSTNIRPCITGAVQLKINQKNLCSIPFILPSKEICTLFEQKTSNFYASFRSNQEQSQTLSAIRDTLLPKLMSGEIRIKEGEEIMKKVA